MNYKKKIGRGLAAFELGKKEKPFKKRISLNINEEIYFKLREKVYKDNSTFTDIILKAIKEYLKKEKNNEKYFGN